MNQNHLRKRIRICIARKKITSLKLGGNILQLGFRNKVGVLRHCKARRIYCIGRKGWMPGRRPGFERRVRWWGAHKLPPCAMGKSCGNESSQGLQQEACSDPWKRDRGTASQSSVPEIWRFILTLPYLIMTPWQHHIVQTAMWLVDPALGWINGIIIIGVICERFGVDNLVRIVTSDNLGSKEYIRLGYWAAGK